MVFVGLFSRATSASRITAATAQVQEVLPASSLPVASPWADSTLSRIVFEDMFGADVPLPTTRAIAMSIPAVSRSRNLLASTICRFPLVEFNGETRTADQPLWLQSTSGATHPQLRMAWTVDDLIFDGLSVWARFNDPTTGYPLAVDRIRRDRWTIDGNGLILVDGHTVDQDQVIVIPGLHEGILCYGADALRDTKDLYKIVRSRLRNPAPNLLLHQTGGTDLNDDEIDALIARWAKAREGANGGVGYLNQSLDAKELGGDGDSQLMIEARNAAALDIARVVGVSGGRIDATAPTATLRYETPSGRNQEFLDFDLALYMTPITAALSMDSVVPSGHRVGFDFGDFIALAPSATGPVMED